MQQRFRFGRSLTLGGQVCVIDEAGRVLLVRHGYRPGWHFPGGGVEIGENAVDAALRELTEETGVVARGAPTLHGIFNHSAQFRGDHIVVYVVRTFEQRHIPPANLEIAEQRFFAPAELPDGTTDGTRRRVAEILDGKPISTSW
jgi:8-oxo-dGTP pyrophosphatase MutT (NUDIX family)